MKNLEIRSQKLEIGGQLKAENQRLLIGNQGINKFLFIILLLWGLGGFAQIYPVQISSYFIPPHTTRISDYATSTEDKYIVQFLDTDIQDFNRKVRLKLTIKGNGITAQSTNFVQNAPDFYLNGGQPLRLSNIDLRAYFELDNLQGLSPQQYSQPLPDGVYQFCWEVFDFNTNAKLSSQSCQPVYLVLNDPPYLNIPARNENIVARDPTNIVFTWTPRQLNAINVSYEFQLRELWDDGIDPQAAFLASPDLWTEETPSTSLLYDMGKPGLISGKKYGWRVRAKSISGISENAVFKNNGYSEIYWFKYAADCAAPTFVLSEAQSPTRVKITWQSATAQNKFHIQYRRKKDNLPIAENETKKEKQKRERADATVYEWFEEFTQNTQLQITNLEEGATYEFRVGATCDPLTNFSQSYTYSGIQEFTMPAKSVKTAGYNCGVAPQITIANKTPLPNLGKNEVFTAGDFEITVLERTGTNGIFSGKGYMIVPYLADTKLAVEFNNIKINSSYQMYDGFVFTTYDKTWSDVVDVQPLVDAVGNAIDVVGDAIREINIFGPNIDVPDTNTLNNTNTPNQNQNITTQTTVNPVTTVKTTANTSSSTTNNNNDNSTPTTNPATTNTNNNVDNVAPIPEKLAFEATKLTACDSKTKKRIAKEGETLYYVNSGEKPKTDITLTISPNLDKDKIKDYVHWFSNNTAIDKSEGLLKFKPKDLDKDATIKSVAGFPTQNTKLVDVKFVDENYNKTKLTIGTTSNPFFKKALELTSLMEKISSKLDKIPFFKRMKKNENIEGKIGFYFDIIAFEQELKNKEDKESRLYYQEKKGKGGIDIGLSGSVKQTIWGLPIDKIPVVGDKLKEYISAGVYVVGTAKTGSELKGELVEYKYVNSQQWKEISNQVNPAVIKLDVDFGVGAEVKFLKKNEYLSFAGDANGKAKAEIFTVGWRNNNFQYGFIQNGVFIDFQATFSGTFLGKKLETTPYYQRIVLVEPQTVQ